MKVLIIQSELVHCRACNGTGIELVEGSAETYVQTCPACKGAKHVHQTPYTIDYVEGAETPTARIECLDSVPDQKTAIDRCLKFALRRTEQGVSGIVIVSDANGEQIFSARVEAGGILASKPKSRTS